MQNPTNEKTSPRQFANDYVETMRALPDHQRKFFAAATFVIGVIGIGLVSWSLFPPLQDLHSLSQHDAQTQAPTNPDVPTPPITDGTQSTAGIGADDTSSNPLFADVNTISQIGPIKGFLDSFNAVKDLLVPADIQTNTQAGLWQTISDKLWGRTQEIASKTEVFARYAFEQGKKFVNFLAKQALHYVPDTLNKLISLTGGMSQ